MATDTATKQNDTKPAEAPKAAAPAEAAKPATPKRKPASRAKTKTAAKSRTRTASKSRTATASKSRKPAAAQTTATATPRPQAKVLNGSQQFVAGVIDAQEKTVTAIVDYQTRAAELSQIPGATAVAEAQAKILRSVTDTYANAARALLK
jgi:hypothetical protein